jgi:site-specific recombinase XerD
MIEKNIPTDQEINKLKHFSCRDEKHAKRDFCFMAIFIYGGLRESEIVNLRIIDIKLEDRFINIIGKGNKFRQVVINSIMYDAISEYLEERLSINTVNPHLFIGQKNMKNTEPLRRNFCNRLLNKYKELCNVKYLHPHALRAYFCTNALHNAGYSIDQVANQAGHSSLNTTKGYLITKKQDLISLAENL